MVRYDEVDLAIGNLATDPEINEYTSPSPQIIATHAVWVTRFPGKISSAYNILKVFDIFTWIAILISLIFATIVLLFLSNLLKTLGFNQPDHVMIALLPLSLLNAEGMPDWFLFHNKRILSGSVLVLTWALASTLLTFAFSSNLRAIVLSPATGVPLEKSSEIVERGMYIIMEEVARSYWSNYFLLSPNPDQVKLMETVVFINSTIEAVKQTYYDKNAVLLGARGYVEGSLKENQEFLEILLKTKEPPFYYGEEQLWPFYGFWLTQKNSIWSERIYNHLLICEQAKLDSKVWNTMFKGLIFEEYSTNL
ncbi:uncharacterized protein LOC111717060, partial [Eurytemora carolleeae]|uniref:uncharacterized protein LOC111717060 n=1 Tax=Eurytemora carolleeae TaxID=1294199 RepID=UPI000C76A8FE